MMLQALYQYYQRLLDDPNSQIAPPGFQHVGFSHAIVLKRDGRFSHFLTLTQDKTPKTLLVPQAVKKTSGVSSNLLWENPFYIFGIPKNDTKKDQERAVKQQEAFLDRIRDVFDEAESFPEIQAIMKFVTTKPLDQAEQDPLWPEILEAGRNLCFRIEGQEGAVTDQKSIKTIIAKSAKTSTDSVNVQCLVTGDFAPVAELHPAIAGVWGAQSSGANIVSFNMEAVTSYGLDKGENAPVSEEAAFAYTTVLNHMLRKGSSQRMQVGDASTVFWSDEPNDPVVDEFALLLSGPPKESKPSVEQEVEPIRKLLSAVQSGHLPEADDKKFFYILGLGPNAARIAIRFWHQGSVNEIRKRLAEHFQDIEMTGPPNRSPHPRLYFLLLSTALQSKAANVIPNLGGEVFRAILAGLPYPRVFMQQALLRTRAEQDVTQERAAIFKASINRNLRQGNTQEKELTMALDPDNTHQAYLLGRLFAAIERTQRLALGGDVNATLRDRFYASASSTPSSVMPWLQRMNTQHMRKLRREKPGAAYNLEKLIGSIMDLMPAQGYPSYLPPDDQGRFAVGYYHQRQDFFTKKLNDTETEPVTEEEQSHE